MLGTMMMGKSRTVAWVLFALALFALSACAQPKCDLFKGHWIADDTRPYYNEQCPFLVSTAIFSERNFKLRPFWKTRFAVSRGTNQCSENVIVLLTHLECEKLDGEVLRYPATITFHSYPSRPFVQSGNTRCMSNGRQKDGYVRWSWFSTDCQKTIRMQPE